VASAGRPAAHLTTLLEQFCTTCTNDADALYILGDLFEAWIGDDAGMPAYSRVIEALQELPVPLFVAHGNRDFLLGEAFCEATGARLIVDPAVVTCENHKILISHGDLLCTDDQEYQQVRSMARSPQWRADFLSQSIDQRTQQAARFRDQSEAANAGKSAEIMDVTIAAVVDLLEENQLLTLVHGHTHRPARHTHATANGEATRWVLGSWQQAGEILRWDEQGPALIKIADYLS
jgi:UDP-2,3-diacylglucosamine hydrolase